MSALVSVLYDLEQGTQDWLDLRKTKITATDAATILGINPWKTKIQLYHDKLSDAPPMQCNGAMRRGTELEPVARDLFMLKTGLRFEPRVLVKDWAMASLDGLSLCGKYILEIKCPGEKTHAMAVAGKVPDYYYPQIQHQMYVANVQLAFYFSFDGFDGVTVEVKRDDKFIENMLIEEKKFYDCLMSKTPPPEDFKTRTDDLWSQCAYKWKTLSKTIKELEKDEEEMRNQLVYLAGESNAKGCGISVSQVARKGTIDYAKIPELSTLNLEIYRKPSTSSWRITCV
jgi:putative phage-type endonuclease